LARLKEADFPNLPLNFDRFTTVIRRAFALADPRLMSPSSSSI